MALVRGFKRKADDADASSIECCSTALQKDTGRTLQLVEKTFGFRVEGSGQELKVEVVYEHAISPGSGPSGVAGWPWPSGVLLSRLLLQPRPLGSNWMEFVFGRRSALKVLELGAGTGIPSICLAQQGHKCFATDLESVLPITCANIAANKLSIATAGGSVTPFALRLGDAKDIVGVESMLALHSCEDFPEERLRREAIGIRRREDKDEYRNERLFDVVLGADLCYDPLLYDPLLQTLCKLSFRKCLLVIVQRPDLGEETFENHCVDKGVKLNLRFTEVPQAANGGSGPCRVNVYELFPESLAHILELSSLAKCA